MHPQDKSHPVIVLLLLAMACSSGGDSGSSADSVTRQESSGNFQDCGDGTLLDTVNDLLWETKTGEFDPSNPALSVVCDSRVSPLANECTDPHNVMNRYNWCYTAGTIRCEQSAPNAAETGSAFFDFLGQLNCEPATVGSAPCEPLGNATTWRFPTSDELRTIMVGIEASPTQPQTYLPGGPAIDGAFFSTGTATIKSFYWSNDPVSAAVAASPGCPKPRTPCHQAANFGIGSIIADATPVEKDPNAKIKMSLGYYVRAVRDGSSCAP